MKPIRIFLADDHAVLRAGLRALLNGEPDMTVVGEAEDGEECVHQAVALRPDIVLLDISVKTVKTYKARLMDKLDLSSCAALVRFALKHGVLEEGEG